MKSFASDNYAGACPEVFAMLQHVNTAHVPAYGDDPYTEKAIFLIQQAFGEDTAVFFVSNGTAANNLALKALTRSHHSIICADSAHINTHEAGAPENATGCKLITLPAQNGKISAEQINQAYQNEARWGCHATLPRVVNITQPTEVGTLYTLNELAAISTICKQHKMKLHMDGCRLFHASAALNVTLKELTTLCGVDVLSLGGSKHGLLFGEGLVFLQPDLATEFAHLQKQCFQLHSKMRFLSAQFIPLFEQGLGHKNAIHTNTLCARLAKGLSSIHGVSFVYPVETNQIFAHVTPAIIEATQSHYPYYVYDEASALIRLVTSFDTTKDEVDHFISLATSA